MKNQIKEISSLLENRRNAAIVLERLEAKEGGEWRNPEVVIRSRNGNCGNEQFISPGKLGLQDVAEMILDISIRRQRKVVADLDEKISAMAKAAGFEVTA